MWLLVSNIPGITQAERESKHSLQQHKLALLSLLSWDEEERLPSSPVLLKWNEFSSLNSVLLICMSWYHPFSQEQVWTGYFGSPGQPHATLSSDAFLLVSLFPPPPPKLPPHTHRTCPPLHPILVPNISTFLTTFA